MLRLLGDGLSLSECAARLEISRSTANSHRARLMERLELNNRDEVIVFAKQWSACSEQPDGTRETSSKSVNLSELDDGEELRANGRRVYGEPNPSFSANQENGGESGSQLTTSQADRYSPSARFAGSLP